MGYPRRAFRFEKRFVSSGAVTGFIHLIDARNNPSGVLADTTSLYTREALVRWNSANAAENHSLLLRGTDCRTSDVGHWLAMTRWKLAAAVREPLRQNQRFCHLPRRRWLRIPRFRPRAKSSVTAHLLLSPPNPVAQPSAALLRYGCGIPLAGTVPAELRRGPRWGRHKERRKKIE